jgi:subtilisin family serine protease
VRRLRSIGFVVSSSVALLLPACGGGGGGSTPSTASPSPTPSSSQTGFTCPSSDTSFAVASSGSGTSEARRRFVTYRTSTTQSSSSNLLVVTYDSSRLTNGATTLDARAVSYGGRAVGQINFSGVNRAARMISVDPSRLTQAEASLRSLPGVINAQPLQRRYPASVSGPYFTSDPDPYFYSSSKGDTAFPYENDSTPGQWDMHVVRLEDAFAYAQSNNGSSVTSANALGSTSVKLAVIDTGEDVTHPVLANAHVVRTECFITDTSNVQSTSSFVTDPTGHGTDVTGIAAGASARGFGFQGDAGNVSLMLYRVFPTPDDSCTNPNSNDPRCSAADVDIASALNDAVANGANVISMSFGGDTCVAPSSTNPGGDPSTVEGTAIENAIAKNVVLVAASGNGAPKTSGVASPGCDSGVIAAGASAYNDGHQNGSGYTGPDTEYVANYSQFGSVNSVGSASSWGIVAPGGDPYCPTSSTGECASNGTTYDLHWVENIWTSTPFDANFAGDCSSPDFFGGSNDCRILIAGTSMATPHVAGAAALILSVSSAYQSSSAMKSLLCSTADSIGTTSSPQGCGRLDVYRAMAKALNDPVQPTSPPQ